MGGGGLEVNARVRHSVQWQGDEEDIFLQINLRCIGRQREAIWHGG